jgi:hypothetical protein
MRNVLITVMIFGLAACGGSNRGSNARSPAPIYAPTASGPIKSACLASDRRARSDQLCGCIQAVANQTLNRSDQMRAIKFYGDPQAAQDARQSSKPSDERFWKVYSDYGNRAAQICS